MPYKGISDKSLPPNVQKLDAATRAIWVKAFNGSFAKCSTDGGKDCEALAFKVANGAVKQGSAATKAKYQMGTVRVPGKPARRMLINTSGKPSGRDDVFDVSPFNRPGTRVSVRPNRAPRLRSNARRKEYDDETVIELGDDVYPDIDDEYDDDDEYEIDLPDSIAEKCSPEMGTIAYRPYSGAISFDEIDMYRESEIATRERQAVVDDYRTLTNNILEDPELSDAEKAKALKSATDDLSKRVQNPSRLKSFVRFLTGDSATEIAEKKLPARARGFVYPYGSRPGKRGDTSSPIARYEQPIRNRGKVLTNASNIKRGKPAQQKRNTRQGAPAYTRSRSQSVRDANRRLKSATIDDPESKFTVFKDADGEWRWLAIASNNFQDRDQEIITHEAHKNYVKYVDETEDYPELRLWHIPPTKIGVADVIDENDGFLFGTGTFDDQEVAEQLAEVGKEIDLAVSMGFEYKPGDRDDGVFDWYKAFEFSVLPREHASNVLTAFAQQNPSSEKGFILDKRKKEFLARVLGDEAVDDLLETTAAIGAKAKGIGIAFKSDDDDYDDDDGADEQVAAIAEAFKEAMKPVTDSMAGIVARLDQQDTALKMQNRAIKALARDADERVEERVADLLAPRTSVQVRRKSVDSDDDDDEFEPEDGDEDDDDGDGDGDDTEEDAKEFAASLKSKREDGAELPEHLRHYAQMGLAPLFRNDEAEKAKTFTASRRSFVRRAAGRTSKEMSRDYQPNKKLRRERAENKKTAGARELRNSSDNKRG